MEISDAGFHFLCAAFFARRDDSIERLSHTTKVSRRLCSCVLALQPPWRANAIAKEKSPKATHCAVELLPVIRVRHRRPPAVFLAAGATQAVGGTARTKRERGMPLEAVNWWVNHPPLPCAGRGGHPAQSFDTRHGVGTNGLDCRRGAPGLPHPSQSRTSSPRTNALRQREIDHRSPAERG